MVILMYLIFNKGLFRWRGAPIKKINFAYTFINMHLHIIIYYYALLDMLRI